jgi:large subunit ribosomal protein L25
MSLQAIKRFRLRELNGLRSHLNRFGPLPSLAVPESSQPSPSTSAQPPTTILPNPFLPRLNPKTGRWAPPKYSLRRQAELIKTAKACGIVHLLPPGPKLPQPESSSLTAGTSNSQSESLSGNGVNADASWAMPIRWDGEVQKKEGGAKRGTGIGLYGTRKRMFKGHKWERVMAARIETRKSLMGKMKNRIMRFKQVSMCSRVAS